jgi:hypothetical protein
MCPLRISVSLMLFFASVCATGQENRTDNFRPYHEVSLNLAHARISHVLNANNEPRTTVLGAWGIDYHYWLKQAFCLGVQSVWIADDFKVKARLGKEPETILRRNHPLSTCVSLGYSPVKGFSMFVGSGTEYAPEEPLYVSTFTARYTYAMASGFRVGLDLMYSLKWNHYDTWLLGFLVSKKIASKKK